MDGESKLPEVLAWLKPRLELIGICSSGNQPGVKRMCYLLSKEDLQILETMAWPDHLTRHEQEGVENSLMLKPSVSDYIPGDEA